MAAQSWWHKGQVGGLEVGRRNEQWGEGVWSHPNGIYSSGVLLAGKYEGAGLSLVTRGGGVKCGIRQRLLVAGNVSECGLGDQQRILDFCIHSK